MLIFVALMYFCLARSAIWLMFFPAGRDFVAQLIVAASARLNQMNVALLQLKDRRVEVIGHTGNAGSRAGNLSLRQARAEAVRQYVSQGHPRRADRGLQRRPGPAGGGQPQRRRPRPQPAHRVQGRALARGRMTVRPPAGANALHMAWINPCAGD